MLPTGKLPEECPFWHRGVTLIQFDMVNGSVKQTRLVADKERALKGFIEATAAGIVYVVAWTGAYYTSVFSLDVAGADRLLDERRRRAELTAEKQRARFARMAKETEARAAAKKAALEKKQENTFINKRRAAFGLPPREES